MAFSSYSAKHNQMIEPGPRLLTEGIKDLERKYYGEAQAKFLGSSAVATLALARIRASQNQFPENH